MKAEGGWAAVCTEYCSISPESDETPYVLGAAVGRRGHARAAADDRAAHEHGSLAGIELWHGGVYAEQPRVAPAASWRRRRSRSDLDSVVVPKAMDTRRHPARAGRVGEGGRAALAAPASTSSTSTASHTYLPSQFLSPVYNRRTDEYGGSLREPRPFLAGGDRAGQARRSATTARSRCGSPPTALELSGVPIEEGLEFIRAADHMVDLWDVVIGSMSGPGRLDSGPSRFFDQGYQFGWSGRAREATDKPIVGRRPLHRSRPHGRARPQRRRST